MYWRLALVIFVCLFWLTGVYIILHFVIKFW